jgi:hypothetical protein
MEFKVMALRAQEERVIRGPQERMEGERRRGLLELNKKRD